MTLKEKQRSSAALGEAIERINGLAIRNNLETEHQDEISIALDKQLLNIKAMLQRHQLLIKGEDQ